MLGSSDAHDILGKGKTDATRKAPLPPRKLAAPKQQKKIRVVLAEKQVRVDPSIRAFQRLVMGKLMEVPPNEDYHNPKAKVRGST